MRRSSRPLLSDLPGLIIGGFVQLAMLLAGGYARREGAHVLVFDEHGRILVVRATYARREWILPGGRVERGESPHVAAAREAREETGFEVRVTRLLCVDARRRRGVGFFFAGEVVGGVLQPQLGEISEAGWVAREELARTSPLLHRLIGFVEAAAERDGYLGLEAPA